MNCLYHIKKQIQFICLAPHKCQFQRKLCSECRNGHGADQKYTVSIEIFKEMVSLKLKEFELVQTDITEQRINLQTMFSQTETMLKKIWEELQQSIIQIFDMIEEQNKSYLNIFNTNIIEHSYTDLEKLVSIVEGNTLNLWNAQKNFYLTKLEKANNLWGLEIKAFNEKIKKEIKKFVKLDSNIQSYVQSNQEEYNQMQNDQQINKKLSEDLQQKSHQGKEDYQRKEDLQEVLTQVHDADESIFKLIIEIVREEKISDILEFFTNIDNQKLYDSCTNKKENLFDIKQKIEKIINILRNILDHTFSRNDFSTETNQKEKQNLIKTITGNSKIIDFLLFIVYLTSIDEKFIQCGSNALHILVSLKINLANRSFQDIRIKNTALIGGNFVRCNFSGSEFENVDISGVNLNGALLSNCKWTKIKINQLNSLQGHIRTISSVCFSPDGTTLASGSGDRSIRLWDVKTGQQQAKLDGHSDSVSSVCFSPDGTTLASGSDDKSISIWDIKTGKQKTKFDVLSDYVRSVCFSPDGTTLASGSDDNSIRLWDVKTGQQKAKLGGHTSFIFSVCFSPDGTILASGSDDKSIRLYDIRKGQQKAQFDGHYSYVLTVCFSPDGTTLASGSGDQTILLWDVRKGKIQAKLDGHARSVYSVCFSPDGATLASGSDDNSIRLWDTKTGQQKAKLDGHTSTVFSVCFSPDGATLASGSDDKSIRLWNVKTGLQMETSYKELLSQFKTQFNQNNSLAELTSNITILLISQQAIFQAQGALILQGQFENISGIDLKTFFKQKGSCLLENQKQI